MSTHGWFCAEESDARQAGAAVEGTLPDAGDAITNRDARQAGARLESFLSRFLVSPSSSLPLSLAPSQPPTTRESKRLCPALSLSPSLPLYLFVVDGCPTQAINIFKIEVSRFRF